jgi:O-antigen/teichoic acid export membrane protein
MFRYSIPVMLTWGILILISNMDIPLVKHYFDEYQAGIYSSASIIGKIGYFLPTVLLYAFFPEVINNDKLGKSSIPLLAFMLGITLLICASYVLVVFFFKEALITLLFGEKYLLAGEYLTRITIFMSIVGVITVLFNFFLAKEIYYYLYASTIVMFLGCLAFVFGEMNSPNDILSILLYTSTALLVTTVLHTFYRYREHLYGWFYKERYS